MDRRIPPEPQLPVAAVRRDVLELKVKQGVHKEAFDSALQRADHRRTMDSRDRVVSAGVKQSHAAQRFDEGNGKNLLHQARADIDTSAKPSMLRKSESVQITQLEFGREFIGVPLGLQDFTAATVNAPAPSASTNTLSDESMAMMFKKLNSNSYELGESLELEFVDDPSGVVGVKLTKSIDNSWAINLVLTPNENRANEDEAELSHNLVAQLQQKGISVDSLSVETNQYSTRVVAN